MGLTCEPRHLCAHCLIRIAAHRARHQWTASVHVWDGQQAAEEAFEGATLGEQWRWANRTVSDIARTLHAARGHTHDPVTGMRHGHYASHGEAASAIMSPSSHGLTTAVFAVANVNDDRSVPKLIEMTHPRYVSPHPAPAPPCPALPPPPRLAGFTPPAPRLH